MARAVRPRLEVKRKPLSDVIVDIEPLPTALGVKFFYHYNKPESLRRKEPIITLHVEGNCHFVNSLGIHVDTTSRTSKRQPRFVMEGVTKRVEFVSYHETDNPRKRLVRAIIS